MATMYLPLTVIKRETDKAYQLECPSSSYSYAKARFWVSKRFAQKQRYGQVEYLQIYFNPQQRIELTRYISRREKPEAFQVPADLVASMYSIHHDQMLLKLEHQRMALQADMEFEQRMRG